MEESGRSPPVTSTSPPREQGEASLSSSGVKKWCLSFLVSLQKSFGYVKAFVVGQTKKVTAKNENEAARAELATAKMQVEATDAAELTKQRLGISH